MKNKRKELIMPLAAVLSGTLFLTSIPVMTFADEQADTLVTVQEDSVQENESAKEPEAVGETEGAQDTEAKEDVQEKIKPGVENGVSYIDENDGDQSVSTYTNLTKDTETLSEAIDSWYVADASFSTNKRIKVQGNVNLILCDGVTLTLKKGITVENGSSLTIWQQSGKTGKLTATSSDNHVAAISVNDGSSLTVNGGTITATTKTGDAAGIGGDKGKASGNITINAGTVKATGGSHGAGIGGGRNGEGKLITITGGTVEAKGGDYAAGIGGGGDSGADKIYIRGGKVDAWGGTESAGIGSANKGHVNEIEITGGRVYAFGKKNAAGIGGGDGNEQNGTYGTITISGEGTKVGAYGGAQAAGIGTGNDAKKNNGTINITDGAWVQAIGGSKSELFIDENDNVKRNWEEPGTHKYKEAYEEFYDGTESGAGIGGGDLTPGGTINISGKGTHVEAYGAENAAGIGSGCDAGSIGDITITDAYVYARGGAMRDTYDDFPEGIRGNGGAGIGGGRNSGSGGNITIKGATVNARGSENAAGIGGGDEGGFDKITISDGANVTARAGTNGAGIGTGDVTDHKNKAAWKTGTIEITGANTKVDAYGGNNAAGIGGGEDGYGFEINIKDVGRSEGATGFVKATAAGRAAGIGGGSGQSFKSINIENAVVTATGGYGAGIGGGGGQLEKQDPAHVNGGDIYIKDSSVVGASMFGGAGIGGGIFGRADNITISGGMVVANGGCMFSPEGMPAFAMSVMSNLMTLSSFEQDLFHVNNAYGATGTVGGILASVAGTIVGEAFKGITKLFGVDTTPTIICYTGAGIGGGYKSAGGNITISDNAAVSATAGVLPPGMEKYDKNAYKDKSANIGRGKKYNGSDATNVNIYSGAAVTTAVVDLKTGPVVYQGRNIQTYEPVLSNVQTGFSDDPEVMSRIDNFKYQLAIIQPGGTPVTFDSDGGSEVDDQVVGTGNPVAKPADPVREGFEFLGWYQVNADGTEELYDFSKPVTAETNLKAHWRDLNKEFDIIIDNYKESRIATNYATSKEKKEIYVYESKDVKLTGVVVTDEDGNNIEVTKSVTEDGTRYTFTMPYKNVHVRGVVAQNHKIIIDDTNKGKIVTSYSEAKLDTLVSIILTDRKLHDLTVLDDKNQSVQLTEVAANTYTFVMPDSDVYVYADVWGVDPYEINIKEGAPAVDFANIADLAYDVILESIESQYLLMEVTPFEESQVPEADRKAISDKAAGLGVHTGQWFDISLYICNRENDEKINQLHKTDKPVELTAEVPEELRKEGRTYYLIAYLNGEAKVMAITTDTAFDWESDTFCTYMIAYKDAGEATNTDRQSAARRTSGKSYTKTGAASTGDTSPMPAFLALAAVGAAGIVGVLAARRRKKD